MSEGSGQTVDSRCGLWVFEGVERQATNAGLGGQLSSCLLWSWQESGVTISVASNGRRMEMEAGAEMQRCSGI